MRILELLKGGRQTDKDGTEFRIGKETRTYDELVDEMMAWNIEHTNILEILRGEIEEERLSKWSDALEKGIRKNLDLPSGKVDENPLYPVYMDLYKFVRGLRPRLLSNPSMKHVKKMGKSDPLSICIICGIRALQKERGKKRLIDTLQWMMLERYLV